MREMGGEGGRKRESSRCTTKEKDLDKYSPPFSRPGLKGFRCCRFYDEFVRRREKAERDKGDGRMRAERVILEIRRGKWAKERIKREERKKGVRGWR